MSKYDVPITQNGLVKITSNYEYVLGQLEGNLLDFQLEFSKADWIEEEVEIIAAELENTAKYFAEQQGLAPGMPSSKSMWEEDEFHVNSGTLYDSIQGIPKGYKAKLIADAKNSREQFYAGHIEYGFHDRADNFVPARPFLRPALYAVSEATKGNLGNILENLIRNMFSSEGYNGYRNLQFSRISPNRNKAWSLMHQPTGMKVRNSLENTGWNNKDLGKKLSWDRYNINKKHLFKQHPEWGGTFKRSPNSYKPRNVRKKVAEGFLKKVEVQKRQRLNSLLFGQGQLTKKEQLGLTKLGQKTYKESQRKLKNRLKTEKWRKEHPEKTQPKNTKTSKSNKKSTKTSQQPKRGSNSQKQEKKGKSLLEQIRGKKGYR